MIEHLRLISQATAKDRQALVIVDRAGWHITGATSGAGTAYPSETWHDLVYHNGYVYVTEDMNKDRGGFDYDK
jgi:hypothetical protein